MDSEKRKFILLALIVVSAVVIGLIIYFLVFYSYNNAKQATNNTQTPETVLPAATIIANTPTTTELNQATNNTQATPVDLVQTNFEQVAKSFASRFGTYSNQGGSDQFADLKLFTTKKMQTWLEGYTKNLLAGLQDYSSSFVVTSKAVSTQVVSWDKNAGQAVVIVSMRRSEQSGEAEPKITNKDLKVNMILNGKRWQVDEATWQ